jgi:hypothetical protein
MRAISRFYLAVAAVAWAVGVAGAAPASGLKPGDEVSAWEPVHVAGPHAGTKVCPVCTYLEAPVLLAFARDLPAAETLVKTIGEVATSHRGGKLRVMLVVLDGSDEQLRRLAADAGLTGVMVCRPDPARRAKQLAAYKIDPAAATTVMLYQDYVVRQSWSGLRATDLAAVRAAADSYLPKP